MNTFRRFLQLTYHNRSARFTPTGTCFVLMTLAVGVASINTGNNLLYLILAMMLSFIILSGVLSEQALWNLRAERVLPAHSFAGKTLSVYMQVENRRRRLPSFSFSVQEAEGTGIQSSPLYIYKLAAGQRLLSSTRILFPHRGLYHLRGIRFETSFPFGFFQKSLIRDQPQEVIVYPKLCHLPHKLSALLAGLGESREVPLYGPGSAIRSLRDYTPSDDARAIHWKASARQDRLLLKEYEHEDEQHLFLFLSNHLPPPPTEEDHQVLEQAISLTASVAYHWLMQGYGLEVQTMTGEIPMGKGLPHLLKVLNLLALLEPVNKPSSLNRSIRISTVLPVPRLLILPRSDPFWEKRRSAFTQVLTVTDPDLQKAVAEAALQ